MKIALFFIVLITGYVAFWYSLIAVLEGYGIINLQGG
jgi:hypothetical protein